VRVKGIEAEFTGLVSDSLRFDGNLALTDSKVKSDTLAIDSALAEDASTPILLANGGNPFDPAVTAARGATAISLKGNELSKIPHVVANARLTYARSLDDYGQFKISISYTYRDNFQARVFNNPIADPVPSYNMVDVNVAWAPTSGNWTAELIVKNLFNEDAVNSRFTDNFGVAATSEELLAPRLVLGRLSYQY
ncbi:MAG: TonB-dependent receptor, partial [Alphaproteobacteria bacterium]